MPDHIVPQNGHQESSTGSVAVVSLANALLDMYITVKDDTLVLRHYINFNLTRLVIDFTFFFLFVSLNFHQR